MALKRLSRKEAKDLLGKRLRKCVVCKQIKSLEVFYKNKFRHGGYAYECKECKDDFHKRYRQNDYVKKAERERAKKYRIKNKEKLLNKRYLKQYGITTKKKERTLEQQNFQCKICGSKINMISGHIDHCHKNEKTRGILCSNCNTAIGLFKDNIGILKKAIQYLSI